MIDPSILNEVIKKLEQDANLIRIKKVMFCACRGKWENETEQLNRLSMRELIQEVYRINPQFEKLNLTLNQILSKINKKSEYQLVVNTILSQVGRLYVEEQEEHPTGISAVPNLNPNLYSQGVTFQQPRIDPQPYDNNRKIKNSGDLFEVKFKLMQHTNPLRTKILIFSTLEHEFNFNETDWSLLRNQSLEDLIRQLLQVFTSINHLESHLNKMAEYLDNYDENIQVVTVLVESLAPFYGQVKMGVTSLLTAQELEIQSSCTTQVMPPQAHQDITLSHQSILKQHYLTSDAIDINESETLHLFSDENSRLEFTGAEVYPSTNQPLKQNFISASLLSETLNYQPPTSPNRSRENDIAIEFQGQIEQSVIAGITSIHQILQDLEIYINASLENSTVEERLHLKYQTLKVFVKRVQEETANFWEVVCQAEAAERQALSSQETSISPETEQNDATVGQRNGLQILQLAQQGSAKAIATLISQSLRPRGINTLAKTKDGCLHIILESDHTPLQEPIVQWLYQKLLDLKVSSIQNVKIYGRNTTNKSIAWTQEFNYNATQK